MSRRNYGEADRILTIFTKHYGKLRVIAKGVRRTTSRKKGSVELFNYIKFFAVSGKRLDLITEVEVKSGFLGFKKDLNKVAVAYHLAEVVERLTPENQENKEILELLIIAYARLEKLDYWQLYDFALTFKVKILEELGFLEREQPAPKNLDAFIEDLINGKLRTKKFLVSLSH